jgi:hypothetical protein
LTISNPDATASVNLFYGVRCHFVVWKETNNAKDVEFWGWRAQGWYFLAVGLQAGFIQRECCFDCNNHLAGPE